VGPIYNIPNTQKKKKEEINYEKKKKNAITISLPPPLWAVPRKKEKNEEQRVPLSSNQKRGKSKKKKKGKHVLDAFLHPFSSARRTGRRKESTPPIGLPFTPTSRSKGKRSKSREG